jgi:epoxyqueuosine reductase
MTSLKQRIKEIALTNNLDYCGIATAEALRNEPEEEKPDHLLPNAQSVISLGIKLGLGVQWANKLAHTDPDRHQAIYSYLWHGFGLLSLHYIDRTSILITRMLEKEGYLAVPVMSASTFDVRSSLMHFSNFHAAVAAGLGELGWGDLVLTPDAGPRVRFGSVITNARLEADPPYSGPRLCDPSECAKLSNGTPVCASVCPTKAISQKTRKIAIREKEVRAARIDPWKCTWGSMGLNREAGGLKDITMPDEVDADAVFAGLAQRDPVQTMELMVIGRGDYCGKCIMECPVARSPKLDELLKASKQ